MTLSLLFLYSLCLSVGLSLIYGAIRLGRVSMAARGRAAIVSGILLVTFLAALPLLSGWHSRPVITLVPEAETVETQLTAMSEPVAETYLTSEVEMPATEAPTPRVDMWKLLCTIYLCGLCVAFALMLFTIARIMWIALKSESYFELRLSSDEIPGPFSWGGWIVMSQSDYETNGEMLLAHEDAHRSGRHWLDLLLINLLGCLTWYCPVARAIRRELQSTHEYIADKAVLEAGFVPRDYQMLLISKAVGGSRIGAMANCVNSHALKDRILMMQRSAPVSHQWARVLVIVPAAVAMWALASVPALASVASSMMPAIVVPTVVEPVEPMAEEPAVEQSDDEKVLLKPVGTPGAAAETSVKKEPETREPEKAPVTEAEKAVPEVQSKYADKEFEVVEDPPQFPGGMAGFMKYMSENIRYPKECMELGITGRVVVRFIVKSDGTVGKVRVVRSVDPQLDGEAVRLVRCLKGFKPGRINGEAVNVWYTMPVNFSLNDRKAKVEYDKDVSLKVTDEEVDGKLVKTIEINDTTQGKRLTKLTFTTLKEPTFQRKAAGAALAEELDPGL
ncbi:MAG: TonB family protein [Duncaniella sp.]|nr:TonB family protein [Duncaniella sp.]